MSAYNYRARFPLMPQFLSGVYKIFTFRTLMCEAFFETNNLQNVSKAEQMIDRTSGWKDIMEQKC